MHDPKPLRGLFFSPAGRAVSAPRQPARQDSLLDRLEQAIGHRFNNRQLLLEALTHSTYAYEHRGENIKDNERLEFLGDAVLDLAISDVLFRHAGQRDEGYMTKTRALVVRETTLALLADEIRLGDLLLLGRGEEATGGRAKPSNLSNAAEAIFGALYLDAGYDLARARILDLLDEPLQLALAGDLVYDYKSRLLELVQATRGNSTLRFQILDESGPVHERLFTAGVLVDSQLISTGTGCSKKEAEQQAAREALDKLDCNREGCSPKPTDGAGG
ncbi:MAG: ribonuclease III [Clostridiaceae bacterium]|jgi:ribonuclease-3|nr:ribonuclease III [Clostridiaceae bacterium]